MKYGEVRHYLFDVEMLRRRLLRPYFIDMGLTVGQGQPRIKRWTDDTKRAVRCLPDRCNYYVKNT